MKKLKFSSKILVGVLSTSLLLTACVASTEDKAVDVSSKANSDQTQNKNTTENKERRKRPDLFGKVKRIIGNEVVLELVEMPERKTGQDKSAERPANSGVQMGSGQGQRINGNKEMKFTGETKTLLIPVGIPITTFNKGEAKEVDIADIYEGSLLQVWFDENDKENQTITHVTVMQGR